MKRKEPAFPYEIEIGSATFTVYKRTRNKNGEDYSEYRLADCREGKSRDKRKFFYFTSLEAAEAKALELAGAMNTGQADVLTLTTQDKACYLRALKLLEPTGLSLIVAAELVAEMHRRLKGRSPLKAVDYYVEKNPDALPSKTVREAFDELLAAKRNDGAKPVYLKDLNYRIGKFVDSFNCQLANITAPQIAEWLVRVSPAEKDGKPVEFRCNRKNYRLAVGTLFKFAESKDYIPPGHLNFGKVPNPKHLHTEIEVFTVAELEKLLKAAVLNPAALKPGFNTRYAEDQGLLPLLCLGAFAGMRTAEITRQKWSDIDLAGGYIRVTAAKGNTAQKRLIPISENLRRWLSACRNKGEFCCEYGRVEDAIKRLAKRAGIAWKHNALRHSYISYRVALTQNIPQTALEAGNSVAMINKHYRELVKPEQAKAWFSITPEAEEEQRANAAQPSAPEALRP